MNILKHTDSYKYSHFPQYPRDTQYVSSYVTARHASPELPTEHVVFFGLNAFVKKYLNSEQMFGDMDIEDAKRMSAQHGEPFNEDGWRYIRGHHWSLPLAIEAVPEGSVVPLGTPLVQIRNTDPKVPWLTNFVETALLRAIWYPSTVATLSFTAKRRMRKYWEKTVDDANLAGIDFALHDFGARGASSSETALLGGMAHLLNFNGTDTIEALYGVEEFYPATNLVGHNGNARKFDLGVAGYSVPAAEHSTITSWGEDHEDDAILNMIETYGGEGKIYSVVGDSYNIRSFVHRVSAGPILDAIKAKGGRFVIRPDSGNPLSTLQDVLTILSLNLGPEITTNSKGYRVLPPYFRILQGDGVNLESIDHILHQMQISRWSSENFVFGMGGALLQKVNRDTLSFAQKCNAIMIGDKWKPVYKLAPNKNSRPGRIESGLNAVWDSGITYNTESFATIRDRTRTAFNSDEFK